MVFGKFTDDIEKLGEITEEEKNKIYTQFKEQAEKYGLKLLVWGSPMGMHDESVVVFDIGESIDNYLKFLEENITTLPYTNLKTHPIVVF